MTDVASLPFKVKGSIPAIGLGTAGIEDEQCVEAVTTALSAGYRMIDTALAYGNQTSVGEGLRASGIPREEVFVTTKVSFCPAIKDNESICWYDPKNTKGNEACSIDLCLKQLGLEYVDLLLVHQPSTSAKEYCTSVLPHFFELFNSRSNVDAIRPELLPDGTRLREVITKAKFDDLVQTCDKEAALEIRKKTWASMEKALRDGKCKYIGVSNYPAALLTEMESYAEIMPAVNQVELHPWFSRRELLQTAQRLGVVVIAYGSGQSVRLKQDASVNDIAAKHGKSPVQVVLRWNFQQGMASIPGSKTKDHIVSNADIFDWSLSDDDMKLLDSLDDDYPFYWDPDPIVATLA